MKLSNEEIAACCLRPARAVERMKRVKCIYADKCPVAGKCEHSREHDVSCDCHPILCTWSMKYVYCADESGAYTYTGRLTN